MDRKQFREQITQRYVAGKGLEEATLEEISCGVCDPVEQLEYLGNLSDQKLRSSLSQDKTEPRKILAIEQAIPR